MPKNYLMWLFLSLIILILDQITKTWVSTHLSYNQPVNILPYFDLRLLHNTGAAWSILADQGGWQRWFLSALAIIVSIVIMIWLTRLDSKQRWLACALALILGGALGNVVDRLIYGYVVDFIDIYYQAWHWPAFNIADIGISIGAVMLLIDAIIFKQE
ncbi:signal peptidase II [Candidatus Marithrix sp. Canyon 246]|uniref:signal peptidase II n=1 Tax=Candidatus Marithrix sp. Canyon 246 TaxID=1827136 RepID=UPI00084A04A9|nr:signal peptidase II [Candidatus Marithrix sp. Canyon 246]